MNILDTIFGHSGHYVGREYHAPGEPHIGCPHCKQPVRFSDVSNGYQPKGPRLDPRKVVAPGQPASAVQPPMATCQEADPTPDPDAAKVRLALAAEDIQRAIDHITLAIKDDPRLDEALDIYRERLRGIRAALETEARS